MHRCFLALHLTNEYMKSKIIETELDYYPEPTCCICGKVCEVYEIHPHDEQMWCWCKDCQFDTFHKPIDSTDDE